MPGCTFCVVHPRCCHPFHRPGSELRLDPAALCGIQRPRGGGPAASPGQGPGGRAERWPGASAVGDRLVNFVRSQRVSVVTLSPHSARNVSAAWAARGRTPLHMAAANGRVEVVKLLVEVAVAGGARRGWRGPQLQSTCGSLALALRCWLHLVAACIQDADKITRFL